MKSAHWRIAIPAAALIGLAAPALAQRPLRPEERILFLEQQLAATRAAAIQLEQRLGTIERQLQQLINQGETGSHRVNALEAEISKLRADVDGRLSATEARPAVVTDRSETAPQEPAPVRSKPKLQTAAATTPELPEGSGDDAAPSDPGEDAYSEGFHLWRDGKYDRAITALRAFISGFPEHRRASFARNLIGRALLDKGEPRPAAEALLANYRANPKGERAPDSLYYLGQALMNLDQPGQACKAYAELEDVYGATIRSDLQSLLSKGKAEARCS
ncbi:MAG TPA: tetratricopeptide repeat protein [Sphingomicrobium sp.]|nr:tetratricopeptide repeat protein [Sphingomicrobium sp.]